MSSTYRFVLRHLFQEYELEAGEFLIGRSPGCHLTLEDPLISRRHARITVHESFAVLDDLGSRNGTLVNNEPVFENYQLSHSDRIRIGTNEIIFVRERRYPKTKSQPPKPETICQRCGIPFPEDASACPGCGAVLIPDRICLQCRAPLDKDVVYCGRCGAPVDVRDESTIPVELGGGASGWTSEIIDDVITRALSVERFEQAARLLDDKIEGFLKSARARKPDPELLEKISLFNLEIGKGLRDRSRFSWIFDRYGAWALLMSDMLVDRLGAAISGWHEVGGQIDDYLGKLRAAMPDSKDVARLADRLGQITRETR